MEAKTKTPKGNAKAGVMECTTAQFIEICRNGLQMIDDLQQKFEDDDDVSTDLVENYNFIDKVIRSTKPGDNVSAETRNNVRLVLKFASKLNLK